MNSEGINKNTQQPLSAHHRKKAGREKRIKPPLAAPRLHSFSHSFFPKEELYEILAESIEDFICVLDKDAYCLYINKHLSEKIGHSPEDAIGRPVEDLFPAEAPWVKLKNLEKVTRTGEGFHSEDQVAFQDQELWLDTKLVPLKDKDGNVWAVICISRDSTERRRTQKALTVSEERFKELWNNAPVAYHTLDTGGSITRVNLTEAKMLGYTIEEMLGKPIFDFILAGQREEAQKRFRQKIDAKKSLSRSENRVYVRKDGSLIHVTIDDVLDKNKGGKVTGIRTTMVDITDRKLAEEAVIEQKEFSAQLIQSSTAPTFVLDAHHNIIIWNKACEELTGIKEPAVINTSCHWKAFYEYERPCLADIMIDGKYEDMAKYYSVYAKSSILPRGLHGEGWFKNIGGRERYVVFDAAPVYNTKGELIAAIETLRDITEHKKAEEELSQSFNKLRVTLEETVNALASTAEKRDSYTAGHQHRVTQLACAIARAMNVPEDKIEGVRVAATLHDIGKIYVPAEILNKPGKLIDLEMGLIRIHPKVGYDILKMIPFSWPVAQVVLQHHERYDGSGYPLGLVGEDILLEARIIGVADVVEAIAFHRPYRPNLGMDKALEEIVKNKNILYDPIVVDACMRLFDRKQFAFE